MENIKLLSETLKEKHLQFNFERLTPLTLEDILPDVLEFEKTVLTRLEQLTSQRKVDRLFCPRCGLIATGTIVKDRCPMC